MYNEIIASKLSNLTYLGTLKNSNVTAMSKKNEFGDIVKFYAQITKENIIQKISFKATGCSTFLAMCSYFCELIEGKSIEKALKINENDLSKITELDSSRVHVYPIILDTFNLLVKKYKKGLEKGIITPIDESNADSKSKHSNPEDNINKKSSKKIKKEEKQAIEEKQTSHLMALREKISNKEKHDKDSKK